MEQKNSLAGIASIEIATILVENVDKLGIWRDLKSCLDTCTLANNGASDGSP